MTLLLSIINDDYSILISDRRISSGSKVVDDQYNKMCILCCDDARVSLAFTGIATSGSFDTSEFIMEALREVGEGNDKLLNMIEELRSRIGLELKRRSLSIYPLIILVSGYRYDSSGAESCAYRISNVRPNGLIEAEFLTTEIAKSHGANIIEFAGMTPAIPAGTRASLTEIAQSTSDPRHALRRAVMALQKSAMSKDAVRTIGQFCNSAIISKKVDTSIVSTFHAPKGAYMISGPNCIITKGIYNYGVVMSSQHLMTGPEIRKREICWCGSGKRFKDCHMKKFGSSHALVPTFKRPVTWVTRIEFEAPRLSGKLFQICGAFH